MFDPQRSHSLFFLAVSKLAPTKAKEELIKTTAVLLSGIHIHALMLFNQYWLEMNYSIILLLII